MVVLGLPRGGVPVAAEVAAALGAPLDVIIVRKLGLPFQPELAMGALGEDGVIVLDPQIIETAGVSEAEVDAVEAAERAELGRRARRYREQRSRVDLHGKTALVVDDGIATGSTARAACRVARLHGAQQVVLAVPVAPLGWKARVVEADECVALETPARFSSVGQHYADFSPTSDAEVIACLAHAADRERAGAAVDADVEVDVGAVRLAGHLNVPAAPLGVVVFAHGSGSSRHSSRNRFVASVLAGAGIGTLLFDLLTTDEELRRANVFDVDLLAGRLTGATRWLRAELGGSIPVGYFGASTGAAAALRAAADPGADVAAVVSRGGRPDLAAGALPAVRAPTLLVVGGDDAAVLELNRSALELLRCERRLEVVPGAGHLFEEPGTLAVAAELATRWFVDHFTPR